MNLQETIIEKLQTLPLEKQQQVLDFVDFLCQKNTVQPEVEASEVTEPEVEVIEPASEELVEGPVIEVNEPPPAYIGAKRLTLDEALMLSEATSVEWKLYRGNGAEVSAAEIEKRIAYLEKKLKAKYKKYQAVLVPYLKEELDKRKAQ